MAFIILITMFTEGQIQQQWVESNETTKNKSKLFEKLDKFNDWLND